MDIEISIRNKTTEDLLSIYIGSRPPYTDLMTFVRKGVYSFIRGQRLSTVLVPEGVDEKLTTMLALIPEYNIAREQSNYKVSDYLRARIGSLAREVDHWYQMPAYTEWR